MPEAFNPACMRTANYLEEALGNMAVKQFSADETLRRTAAIASISIGELVKRLSGQLQSI